MGKTSLFSLLMLCAPACIAGSQTEPARDNTSSLGAGKDAGSSDGGAADGGCICCSGSRGPLAIADVGDAADCSWCPATSRCVSFVGGAVGGTTPFAPSAYTCVTAVSNGGTGGPGADSCKP